jgi:hypothetical protein
VPLPNGKVLGLQVGARVVISMQDGSAGDDDVGSFLRVLLPIIKGSAGSEQLERVSSPQGSSMIAAAMLLMGERSLYWHHDQDQLSVLYGHWQMGGRMEPLGFLAEDDEFCPVHGCGKHNMRDCRILKLWPVGKLQRQGMGTAEGYTHRLAAAIKSPHGDTSHQPRIVPPRQTAAAAGRGMGMGGPSMAAAAAAAGGGAGARGLRAEVGGNSRFSCAAAAAAAGGSGAAGNSTETAHPGWVSREQHDALKRRAKARVGQLQQQVATQQHQVVAQQQQVATLQQQLNTLHHKLQLQQQQQRDCDQALQFERNARQQQQQHQREQEMAAREARVAAREARMAAPAPAPAPARGSPVYSASLGSEEYDPNSPAYRGNEEVFGDSSC